MVDQLIDIFSRYNKIASSLKACGYHYELLEIEGVPVEDTCIPSFDQAILDAIADYQPYDDGT